MTTTIRTATYEEAFEIGENYALEGNIVKGPFVDFEGEERGWVIVVESTT